MNKQRIGKRQQQIIDFQAKVEMGRNMQKIIDYCDERLKELKIERFQINDLKMQAEYHLANPNEEIKVWNTWDVKDKATRDFLLRWL